MRTKSSLSLASLVFGAALTLHVATAQGEVTVQLAVPGDPATQPLKTVDITGSEIDAIVGNKTFSSTAERIFLALAELRSAVADRVREAIASSDKIKSVENVVVQTAPLLLVLRQQPSTISAEINGVVAIATFISKKKNIPLVCEDTKIVAAFHISANATINPLDMSFSPITVPKPKVDVLAAYCTGLLSGGVNAIVEGLLGVISKKAENQLQESLPNSFGFIDLGRTFSLADIAARVDQALPSGPIKDKVMATVDRFLYLASQPASLQLEVKLHPDLFGPGNHLIGLTASSIAPQAVVTVDYPLVDWFGGTPPYDVYLSYLGTTWKVATTNGTSWVGSTNVHTGTRVLVVSTNPVVPGLKSFPAEGEISFVPGGPDCPRCSLR